MFSTDLLPHVPLCLGKRHLFIADLSTRPFITITDRANNGKTRTSVHKIAPRATMTAFDSWNKKKSLRQLVFKIARVSEC